MTQFARRGRLSPDVAAGRRRVLDSVRRHVSRGSGEPPLVLVACSGGPDSLALAAVAAHFARRGTLRVGAVVVDHGLQEDSAAVAARTARTLERTGLGPVVVTAVTVRRDAGGPEMAARTARYAGIAEAVARTGADAVLLGHTLDDQAESVLLGLARGSGTRSLAGMPPVRELDGVTYLRPFLDLSREQTLQICAAEQLEPWHDPTNRDTTLMRSRVRHRVLPLLEDELGPGLARALARSAAILGPDADYLEGAAAELLERARAAAPALPGSLALDLAALRAAHPALRRRALSAAVVAAGGQTPAYERLGALDEFAAGHGAAGPVQMAGKVSVWRRRPAAGTRGPGHLELVRPRPAVPASATRPASASYEERREG
ncbi:tRNA(Ile)-lysidine synthetase [Kocuria rosea subsp. polaris]|uniref:tRNA(Ile)-lysidine synthase n=1 Tax=Kocuria rosea subsp. polaris TaxID=136273 RepID=A0A0W8I321_KOCRO|nr:tRNA lysidine(34) synthetase TilS [Kocuria polaris]KUG52145.1 tRNA(Ile)-lysidine synthetase [Kocuria polaris]